jgi:N-acetylmuramoyl-L-alanine amidase
MTGLRIRKRRLLCGGCVAALCCCAMVQNAPAKTARTTAKTRMATHHRVELSPWQQAVQGREKLERIPAGARTGGEYTEAMDGFRAIYHQTPGDTYAAAAVNAVAELLAEQGRGSHDTKSLKDAVGQYEFLRKQYPGSSLRVGALLAEAQIYQNDLHDADGARKEYALLVKLHPKSEQAEEARAGLASLKIGLRAQGLGLKEQEGREQGSGHRSQKNDEEVAAGGETVRSSFAPMPVTNRKTLVRDVAVSAPASASVKETAGTKAKAGEEAGPAHVAQISEKRQGRLAQVTGIRHWSTPTYTRVAIDLGDDVTYEAARVPTPDRIYFDLHGTRLAQELVGKSFTVTDDGFLKRVRAAQFTNDMTRVVLDVNDVTEYSAFLLPNPYRLIIDIHGGSKGQGSGTRDQGPEVASGRAVSAPQTAVVTKATPARPVPNTVEAKSNTLVEVASLSDQPGRVEATRRPTSRPISAVVKGQGTGSTEQELDTGRRTKKSNAEEANALPARAAAPMADGETSLVRALGLKIGRIVIDAGHGGHDSGTLGAGGIEEKDVVLDVALRLGKMLHERLGAEIIYTRSDDTFIPLETRTAIANKAQADLFLSIHANSSRDESARGVETYYLNFTTQLDALEVAARENAVSDQSIHQLSDLVKKIALKDKIAESREFASDVQKSLYGGLEEGNAGLKDRGVKKAPFVVLIGANMPSILAEISFVTNPKDARQLEEPAYRERVAESLYKGVARYEAGLSGAKMPTERASTQ